MESVSCGLPGSESMKGSKPRLLLHAGTHKTGTTAVQALAHQCRSRLRQAGFLYPNLHADCPGVFPGRSGVLGGGGVFAAAHHHFFHALAGDRRFLNERDCQDLVARWHAECVDSRLDLFLSSESVSRHLLDDRSCPRVERHSLYLERLKALFEPFFEIEIILVFRRPDDFARSLYQEQIMRGSLRDQVGLEDFIEAQRDRFDYPALLARFDNVFSAVKVFTYEALCEQGDLCSAFFAGLGIDLGQFDAAAVVGPVRASLTPQQTVLKLRLNPALERSAPLPHRPSGTPSNRANRTLLAWLRSDSVVGLLTGLYPEARYSFWRDGLQGRRQFLQSLEPDLSMLMHRLGQRFPDLPNREEPVCIQLPDEAQLSSLLSALIHSPARPVAPAPTLEPQSSVQSGWRSRPRLRSVLSRLAQGLRRA